MTQTMMFTTQPIQNHLRAPRPSPRQRGQSIVVALLVLLLLGLVGALFVTVVARNLINAAHGSRLQTADSYASAGLTYADAQLSSSIDGADWRPPLQFAVLDGTNGTTDDRPGIGPPGPAYPNGDMPLTGDTRERLRYKKLVYDPTNNPNGPLKPVPSGTVGDPDLEYLQAGYSRYSTGAGRYLIRVTYNPINLTDDPNNSANKYVSATGLPVPPGKYLKIESIGREGVIDSNDPTTYTNNRSSDKTQAYQVAFKPIGITDYARFETNPDKRSDIANLGVASQFYAQNTDGGIATPGVSDFNATGSTSANGTTPPTVQEYPVITTYGAADAYLKNSTGTLFPNQNIGSAPPSGYMALPGGGSIHSNMPVRFFGTNIIYLNSGTNSPLFQDTAEFGGDLLLDSYNDANPLYTKSATAAAGQQAALILNPTNSAAVTANVSTTPNATTNAYVVPSNSTTLKNGTFDTHVGLVRDGSMQNDPEGLPRSITRLDPPLLDAQDAASQMPRYRAIAMNSAPRPNLMLNGAAYTPSAGTNPSAYGYGKAIYINNPNDVQPDSAAIGGGSTLTDEWLHRTTASAADASKGGWNGLFYNPPGVTIVLGQELTPPANSTTAGVYGIHLVRSAGDSFVGPNGTANAGTEMNVSYADLGSEATNTALDTGTSPDNDIIIYAEGNVRVRGTASPDEGTPTDRAATPRKVTTIPRHITIVTGGTAYIEGNLLKGDSDSSISVLAHDYVCVNTTQFLAGPNVEEHADGTQNPDLPKSSDFLSLNEDHSLLQEFNFGLTGIATPGMKYGNLALYIAAGPESDAPTRVDFDILNSSNASLLTPTPPLPLLLNTFTRTTYDLSSYTSLSGALATDLLQLSVKKDAGQEDGNGVSTVPTAGQNVSLERVAVLPMDIRIEAVLYAQTRSFFVIPGEWFNTNSSDNLETYLAAVGNPIAKPPYRPFTDDRFPLYGQPIDLKITLSGSVSEAQPADIAAQTAWMQKWGWIPQYHGTVNIPPPASTSPENAGHMVSNQPAIGLQIIYDPQAGYPYDPMPATPYYLRSDQFGRPLPFTPKLPVSPGLLYSGQSGEAPLLQ